MRNLFFLIAFFSSTTLFAQDFEYLKVSQGDLNFTKTKLDSNANAVVLREFGTAAVRLDDNYGNLYIDFEYHVRIKILNKNGFENANIIIPLRKYGDKEDTIEELKASTINYTNGAISLTALDKKKIFTEKKNKYVTLTKFTMPNLSEGSIIEYSYHLYSPSIFNFRSWEFQSNIPKLHSEYIAMIPALYNYNVSLRGAQKLTSQNAELNKECLRIAGRTIDCSKMTYIMKDIPALIEEDYMTAPSNFKSAINFELSEYITPTGAKKSITKEWKDVDYELIDDKSFGSQIKRKDLFKELLPDILKNTTDPLSKAKAIFYYIKRNIKQNGFIGLYSENTIKKALETHSGNTGDINLALVAALSAADLDAEAMILSTRSNGLVNTLFPVISDFNYVIAKVNIDGKSYLLDASEPLMPFGLLPLHCINGQGRVIPLKKPSYWYDLTASQRETTRYNLTGELGKDGKIKGVLTNYSIGYAALNKRRRIMAASSIDEFVEKLDESMPKISILKHEIKNLDSLENPLIEAYDVEISAFENANSDPLFFNPFFLNRINRNPFNLNERTYPVDLGSQSEDRISISIKLPDNYTLADKPKELNIGLPNGGGRFLCSSTLEDGVLGFNQLLQFNKPIYDPIEYLALKEFYSRIIQVQKTDIILKKQGK
ncbi:MAG: DUF3857 domain-containing protein [Candidatus Pedobacter colombiensis]|uniref:DUF3857 domain-containing protein n=1 Tax=Candidatus Pedobacter colombiensis TaxID=3121371 RepID=A0AAJ6BAC5_9SPHI|nr:DUF3857 domain-containing protein [Pedobacter sp.]WEK21123.1 MAG: DUF3857 domain-containing protein [Pedobacter sp.]